MNYAATYEGYGQLSLSSQPAFPVAPFLKKYVHSVFDDLQQARQAVQALHDAATMPEAFTLCRARSLSRLLNNGTSSRVAY